MDAYPNVVVVLPVYGAPDELDACLRSLECSVGRRRKIHLADDASPDLRVAEVVESCVARGLLDLHPVRRDRNLGFVGNVNLALRETAPHDVALLNSDTLTTPGWVEALQRCAASDLRIATATPWSNNAEICSFPEFCRNNPLPEPIELGLLAAAAAQVQPGYPELPTAVGFCTYLRRAAIAALGDFDQATFGRGYGEENDFCLRAAAHGWRNVLCDDAYVAHRGGASFSALGLRSGGENLARLNARYPGYNARIAEFILADPLKLQRKHLADCLRSVAREPAQPSLFP
jgi:GT2 family glycosyltransferase